MKRNSLLALSILLSQVITGQEKNYKGSFIPESEARGITANVIQVKIRGNSFTASLHLRQNMVVQIFNDKKDHSNDYTDVAANGRGTVSGNEINGSVSLTVEENEVGVVSRNTPPARIKASISGKEISGQLIIGDENDEPGILPFRAIEAGNEKPELTYPVGNSPKVFNKGWIFGASFSLLNEKGELVDLSNEVEWSGTASFTPAKGKESRPVFNNIGDNSIILTAWYEGKQYTEEYKIITVDANRYARVGSIAKCPADAHGGPADPLIVSGPVMTGNANVLINGLPVACEGDRGRHAACSGPNTFTIRNGDDEVLINGKRVAKVGSETIHCGGKGNIVSVEGYYTGGLTALSKDVNFTGRQGNTIAGTGKPAAGTKMVTGANGLVLISPDLNTVMMVLPNSEAAFQGDDGVYYTVMLEKGALFVNGEKADNNKKLLIETFNEKLVKKGTRFLFSHSKDSSRLIVYEGAVELTLKNDNRIVLVPAGKVYNNDFKNPYIITDTVQFQAAAQLMTIPKDSAYWQLPKPGVTTETPAVTPAGFWEQLKKYWYIAGGGLILVLLLVFAGKRKKAR